MGGSMKKTSAKQGLKDSVSGAAATSAISAPPPAALRPKAADLAGDSASESSLVKLERAMGELTAPKIAPYLQRAVDCVRQDDPAGAGDFALKALQIDEKNAIAWRLMGISRERLGDFASAITCYETALPGLPEQGEIANDIGRLAYRLDQKELAAKLFAFFCQAHPEIPDGANNLACVLREQNRYGEAIDVLKGALAQHPENDLLWNTLGTVLLDQGDATTAIAFFDETVRLNARHAKALYNRGNAKLALGRTDEALDDNEAAMAAARDATDQAMIRLARSTILHCLGRTAEGWADYEARLDPHFADRTAFAFEQTRWAPGAALSGKSLLLVGEQGLGDEVLFAGMIPEIEAALGEGKLTIAVEPRLVALFQRSFPKAMVGAHATFAVNMQTVRGAPFVSDDTSIDLWAPMASLLQEFRASHADFPDRVGYLTPDPDRLAHWRTVLEDAPKGKKIGILWKSMKLTGSRQGHFSPFAQWAPLLKSEGACFVNLQYGDCAEEIAQAKNDMGVEIWTPPGIDLKNDLDDLAALCRAMDLVLGFANATTNIAAAAGAEVWMINAPGNWVQLGAERMLWYPRSRLFTRPVGAEWDEVMNTVAADLQKLIAA
jgi:tetratricopeptide (TPR) repeat protein